LIERGFGLASVTARSLERRRWSVVHFPASPSHAGMATKYISAKNITPASTSTCSFDQKGKPQDDYTALSNAAMLCRVE
jgi:hypothetical protein